MGLTDTAPHLPEGTLCTDRILPDGGVVYSLTAHALAEIERHRWIESEKKGHDVGPSAYEEWLTQCWNGWVRSKLLEHMYGWRCWSAFRSELHGLLRRGTVERHVSNEVLHRVAWILGHGGENLDVIDWAVEHTSEVQNVLWLLEQIDINAARHRLVPDHLRLFLPQTGVSHES
ncbi:MAG: hypothetical protein PF961_03930 [Planctomycetota bacterium]|jgi:hypothetical protein|nr:hypothetical protein [Planctomycetota bacterium]